MNKKIDKNIFLSFFFYLFYYFFMNMSSKIKNLFYLSLIYKNFSLLVIRIYILSNIEY